MKFTCERDTLVEAIATTNRAVGRSTHLPSLSGIKFTVNGDTLTLTGTDLDVTIAASATVNGHEDGGAVIPARLVSDIARSLDPGAVTITATDGNAEVESGRSQFTIRLIELDGFPTGTDMTGEPVDLDANTIPPALRRVIVAASGDEHRPILTGVYFTAHEGGLRLVATDSYRLTIADLPTSTIIEEGNSVLVPSRALAELVRLLDDDTPVTLQLDDRTARFTTGTVQLTVRLIEGDFPNYQGLIPKTQPNKLTIEREPFLDALRRVKLLARESSSPVRLNLADSTDTVDIVAATVDVGEGHEQVDATYTGDPLTIGFNPDFLLEGLEVAGGDTITIECTDQLKPAVIRGDNPDFLYLLMPIKTS